jgi:hypothetical protein
MSKLREVRVFQRHGEVWRRWFASHGADLVVWQDAAGIRSFEFCYDRPHDEHVLRWRQGEGFRHARVDDGEDNPARNRTPIHVADGDCDLGQLARRFQELGSDIDPEVYRFVLGRLTAGS